MVMALFFACAGPEPVSPDTVEPSPPSFACPELQWVQQLGSPGVERAWAVDIASDGDILVGGAFAGPVRFGVDAAGAEVSLEPACNSVLDDGFVARYAPDGSVRWAVSVGGCAWSRTEALVATTDGGVVAAGWFGTAVEVGGVSYANPSPEYEGANQVWVAKWSAAGALEWFVPGYIDFLSSVSSVAVGPDGQVAVAGFFISTTGLTFPDGRNAPMVFPGATQLESNYDAFLFALDRSGAVLWVTSFGNARQDYPGQVAIAADRVVVAHDLTTGDLVFDPSRPDGGRPGRVVPCRRHLARGARRQYADIGFYARSGRF